MVPSSRPAIDPELDHTSKKPKVQEKTTPGLDLPDEAMLGMEKYIEGNREDFMATEGEAFSYPNEYERNLKHHYVAPIEIKRAKLPEPATEGTPKYAKGPLTPMEQQLVDWYRRLTPDRKVAVQKMTSDILNTEADSAERKVAVSVFVKEGPKLTSSTEPQDSASASSSG